MYALKNHDYTNSQHTHGQTYGSSCHRASAYSFGVVLSPAPSWPSGPSRVTRVLAEGRGGYIGSEFEQTILGSSKCLLRFLKNWRGRQRFYDDHIETLEKCYLMWILDCGRC